MNKLERRDYNRRYMQKYRGSLTDEQKQDMKDYKIMYSIPLTRSQAKDLAKWKKHCNNYQHREKIADNNLRRLYSITLQQKIDMVKAQDGLCPICGCELPILIRIVNVDHDHDTGKVRGILCHACNRRLVPVEKMFKEVFSDEKQLKKLFEGITNRGNDVSYIV